MRLTSKQQAELVQSRPVNPEAFDAYMQAYYFFEFFERNTSKDSDMAAKYYERRPNLTGLDIGAVATFTAPPALRSINPRCASLRMTATSLYTFSSLLIFITGLQYSRYRKNGRCRTNWLVVRHRRLEDGIRALSAQATLGRDSFDRILFELRTALERLLRNTRKEFIS